MIAPDGWYSFDTSSIIVGRQNLFPPEVFPSLWTEIDSAVAAGIVRAIDVVKKELSGKDDSASKWAKAQQGLFVPQDYEIQQSLRLVMSRFPRLVQRGGDRSGGDPYVIALAHARGACVVTQEPATNNFDRPKIPDACRGLGVRCLDLVGFIKEQGWSF